MHSVALLTPSHAKDLERFALLCESIDACLTGYTRHYVIVNDDDVPLFAKFCSEKRVVIPVSRYLPNWLWAVPASLLRSRRRIWLSLLSRPVHGWHVQQIAKIAGVLAVPEERVCIIDSDNVFFRKFDIGRYAGAEKSPLYVDRNAIRADAPFHSIWLRNCDALLGLSEPSFPADDFVGNVLVWDKATVRAMTKAIRSATGKSWELALCRKRPFSEYLLYGRFVATSPTHLAAHQIVERSLALAHWDESRLDQSSIEAMIHGASTEQVALCIQSYSGTSIRDIRGVLSAALEHEAA
ncbi:MAG TPA: DUF6492 family protein [Bradyrhizobium sp.]|uniref:DUF6492 family protein n=1 Tax=Bradyrhizobium sp. TaxID=376 RepID=UPI002BFD5BF0|nr:DUF6492 family protein [Bradyrhizobium sp.]HLZ02385.1 DUF6492 family protein [Bradyrhizobium sp.]